jgi:hypothetical protein
VDCLFRVLGLSLKIEIDTSSKRFRKTLRTLHAAFLAIDGRIPAAQDLHFSANISVKLPVLRRRYFA